MKQKTWFFTTVAIMTAIVLAGCPGTGGSDTPTTGELTTLFDLATDPHIQGLDVGTTDHEEILGSTGMARAGGDEAGDNLVAFEIVAHGGRNSLRITADHSGWGAGLDLPNAEFDFQVGDRISVAGYIESIGAPPIWGGELARVQLNSNTNYGQNRPISPIVNAAGPFSFDVRLTSADIATIRTGTSHNVRLELRASGNVSVRVDNILVEGTRATESSSE